VAALIASRFHRSVHLVADSFFHFIESGYVEPWKPEAHEQNMTVMRIVGDAAASYAKAGYVTIVEGVIVPGWFYEPLLERLRADAITVKTVILRPPLDICRERARGRLSRPLADPAVVEQLWRGFIDLGPLEQHVLDNRDEDAAATAQRLVRHLWW